MAYYVYGEGVSGGIRVMGVLNVPTLADLSYYLNPTLYTTAEVTELQARVVVPGNLYNTTTSSITTNLPLDEDLVPQLEVALETYFSRIRQDWWASLIGDGRPTAALDNWILHQVGCGMRAARKEEAFATSSDDDVRGMVSYIVNWISNPDKDAPEGPYVWYTVMRDNSGPAAAWSGTRISPNGGDLAYSDLFTVSSGNITTIPATGSFIPIVGVTLPSDLRTL